MARKIAASAAHPAGHCRIGHAVVFVLALCCAAASCRAAEFAGRVIRVTDGDTITVLDRAQVPHKIRLAGIDAPEKIQPFGAQSARHLAAVLYGRPVLVSWHKRDRYQRIIGRVLVADDECSPSACIYRQDAGLEQLSSGYAWHYKRYQSEQTPERRTAYGLAEWHARALREGLWSTADPMPPWAFRHSHRARHHAQERTGDG